MGAVHRFSLESVNVDGAQYSKTGCVAQRVCRILRDVVGIRLGMVGAFQPGYGTGNFGHVFNAFIHGGEAHIGHLVALGKPVHPQFADQAGWHFFAAGLL